MPDEMPEEKPDQVWSFAVDGVTHRVEATGSVSHRVRWYADGTLVAERKAMEEHLELEGAPGRLSVRFSTLGTPRRATLVEPGDTSAKAIAGIGGVDLEPEPGSPAAAYEDRVRAHPQRYAAIATAGGVAKVVVPIVLATLLARFAFSLDLPWPDWSVPELPDLPDLPLPDLPTVPWPDISWPDWSLPDWSMPRWLAWILDHVTYVWPVVLAFVIARAEIKRRRTQDELRRKRSEEQPHQQSGE